MDMLTKQTIREIHYATQCIINLGLKCPTYIDGNKNVFLFKDPTTLRRYLFSTLDNSIFDVDDNENVIFQENFIQIFENSKHANKDTYTEIDYTLE